MFDRIKAGVKKLANNLKQQQADSDELEKWQSKFSSALSAYQSKLNLMDSREWLYLGTSKVDRNVNNKTTPADGMKQANNVRNVIYEFIETQVDSTIPQPLIKAKSEANEPLAQSIEDCLKADLLEMNMERHNDQQERTCPIQGYSLFEVLWNTGKRAHTYIGDVDVRLLHPKQFVPYPGVWNIQDMPYFFIMSSVTKEYIKDRYDIDVEEEEEEHPEINSLDGNSHINSESSKVTECVAWYKDKDGDIGRYVWCGDTILENIPKYFKRKQNGKDVETFTLDQDYTAADGNVNIPQYTQGEPDELGNSTKTLTQLPYFTPDKYPIVLRENVPIPFEFGGGSDVDVIRDQQDAIKKVISRIEEKILTTTSVVTYPDSLKGKFNLTNAAVTPVSIKPNEVNLFNAYNLAPNVAQDREFALDQYNIAQSTLGITDALQGKPDSSARSGTAKQIQIAQSTGRLKSKQTNKIQAYKELFEIMFQFKLAYSDEARPYVTKGTNGNDIYSEFNRLDFLKQDVAGEWYYDTDFIFNADANGGLPSDRSWQLQQATQLYQYGAYGDIQDPQARIRFWSVLADIHFPGASNVKADLEKAAAQQAQQAQMLQQVQSQMQQSQGQQQTPQGQQIGGLQQ